MAIIKRVSREAAISAVKKLASKKTKKTVSKDVIKKIVKKKIVKKTAVKKKATTKKSPKKTEKKVKAKTTAKKPAVKKPIKKAVKKPAAKTTVKKVIKKEVASKKAVKKVKKPIEKATVSAGVLFVGDIFPYHPKKSEKYMSVDMKNHFHKILLAWKKQLMENADNTMLHMKDEAANYPDPNDRATQEEEFSLELRTRDRERKLIRKIEQTLDLIDSGDYGFCGQCGEEIGIRRLEARPTAKLCVDCKSLDEIKEKQIGSLE